MFLYNENQKYKATHTSTTMYQGFLILPLCALSVSSHQIVSDPGVFGPSIELVHLYNDEFPSGMNTRHFQSLISPMPFEQALIPIQVLPYLQLEGNSPIIHRTWIRTIQSMMLLSLHPMIRKCHIQTQRSTHHPEAQSTTPLAPLVCGIYLYR